MVPFVTWNDPLNGLSHRGGAFELGVLASWNLVMGLDVLIRHHHNDEQALGRALMALCREIDALGPSGYASLPLAEFAPLRNHDIAAAFFFDEVAAPLDRDRSEPWTIVGKHQRVQVPTFNVGGWYDIFLADTITQHRSRLWGGCRARGRTPGDLARSGASLARRSAADTGLEQVSESCFGVLGNVACASSF